MGTRLELQDLLTDLVEASIFFQPPPNVSMTYPAIVYNRDLLDIAFADNSPYKNKWRYQLTVIDRDPDSPIHDLLAGLPYIKYVRHYTTQGLNHDIYELYF
jgi:hypothetical protein